ncbi:MAG: DUF2012 domain-containing protein [Calditrichaeota bacterium]|nr:DUF2012 domain-containing protein [Calditrichota bacterium]
MKKLYFLLLLAFASTAFAGDIVGTIKAKGARNAGNAVVYLDKIEGKTFSAPKKHATMDQKNLSFVPHVLPLLAGTTVDFVNSDDVLHNVFSPDKCADKFNLGTWPKGQSRSYTFKNAGCRPVILCNVHPEMEAYVVVLSNPYFAVSKKDGTFAIKNVPAGKYTLKIWHEKLKGKPVQITVSAAGKVTQDFVIHR